MKFIAELRLLSEFCEFGDMLDDMIRDRLVCGKNDNRIQQRLLVEPQLTLAKATKLAQAAELAKQEAAEINKNSHATPHSGIEMGGAVASDPVNRLTKSSDRECYRCKGRHTPSSCPFKDATCHGCGKIGHIKKACRTKRQSGQGTSIRQTQQQHGRDALTSWKRKFQIITRSMTCLRYLMAVSNQFE